MNTRLLLTTACLNFSGNHKRIFKLVRYTQNKYAVCENTQNSWTNKENLHVEISSSNQKHKTEVYLTKSAWMTELNIYRKRKQVCDDKKLKASNNNLRRLWRKRSKENTIFGVHSLQCRHVHAIWKVTVCPEMNIIASAKAGSCVTAFSKCWQWATEQLVEFWWCFEFQRDKNQRPRGLAHKTTQPCLLYYSFSSHRSQFGRKWPAWWRSACSELMCLTSKTNIQKKNYKAYRGRNR